MIKMIDQIVGLSRRADRLYKGGNGRPAALVARAARQMRMVATRHPEANAVLLYRYTDAAQAAVERGEGLRMKMPSEVG